MAIVVPYIRGKQLGKRCRRILGRGKKEKDNAEAQRTQRKRREWKDEETPYAEVTDSAGTQRRKTQEHSQE
jgi:hypothetical protein